MKPVLKRLLRLSLYALLLMVVTSFMYALYLKWFPPITTPLIVMRGVQGDPDGKPGFHIRSTWKSYDNISSYAKLAVIASEDQRFAEHSGFDYEAIEKAAKHNRNSKRVRGASTISQQVAKNVFLWPSRSWVRKGVEVYFTFLIETLWSKQRILEMYLNVAELGNGVFGVEAASQKYFHKPAKSLTRPEGALLAAILPNPRKYSASKPSAYVRQRQANIIRFMRMIGGKEYLEQL